ncbi:Uu.00g092250.m01.CDS01 [Anthostomella pinea]|uniref:Uu.00g092250.m01.CDS01 n=1 Tax=Anthostomella pinea TaxID=933095 RepID=A0AAI8YI18_9PEZI|nr:Uu.00g092250.m01.CDS01 [Anthostomella pinea]
MPPPQGAWNPIEGPGDYTTTKIIHNDTYPAIDPTKADHTGHAVFVSGASRGIGRALAIAYARAGASHIAIGARSDLTEVAATLKKAAREAGRPEPEVLTIELDVTSQASVEDAAKQMDTQFGNLDIAINNAGILDEMKYIADTSPDAWWRTYEVNVRGPYLISRSCIPLLLKGQQKTLITVSSVGAHVVMPGLSAYQPSKLAVLRLMEFAAAEYKDQGLVAFAVHPGNILTDIVDGGEGMDEQFKAVFTETVELCADSLVYLTDEKREWLSGRYINCTWDLPELTSSPKKGPNHRARPAESEAGSVV